MNKKRIFGAVCIVTFLGFIFIAMGQVEILIKNIPKPGDENPAEQIPVLKNPKLVLKKSERKLYLFEDEKLIKIYKIALGFAPEGNKEKQGDGKTPEGEFYIFTKNPKSRFYLSLGLSYPNIPAAERGLNAKLINRAEYNAIIKAIGEKKMPPQKTALGGEIYIHGGGAEKDWTWGCAALENEEIKELFESVPVGAKVIIEP